MSTLTGFQRATVDHVIARFYGLNPGRRFLVADETGLGKSLVARGVIAKSIEHLQDDPDVGRIDVVYVCSNTDIATQNIGRLDVTGDPHLPFASRLTLLAKHARQLTTHDGQFLKPVNLVSFTPGTSFDMGWQTGKAEERALLFLLLEQELALAGWRATAALRLLQQGVTRLERFSGVVNQLRYELADDLDPVVTRSFRTAARRAGLFRQFNDLIDSLGRRRHLPEQLNSDAKALTGRMRATLAKSSIQTLEPDLIILDEFQRFRDLLDPGTPAGELAHHLFDHPDARVLLLSATPYKPFTYAEEAVNGDDHFADFIKTIDFLTADSPTASTQAIAADLVNYRNSVTGGADVGQVCERLRQQLLQVMCRSERPQLANADMVTEVLQLADNIDTDDLLGYVTLRHLAKQVGGQATVEYWKSAPYFINFCDGYQLAAKIRDALDDPELAPTVRGLLRRTQHIDPAALLNYQPLDFGNARMRQLAEQTVGAGWWQLLWIPPSLPYLQPGGPYAEPFAATVTKRLVFSSWTATPTAVASLLSYDAERRIVAGSRLTQNTAAARGSIATRLTYRTERGRPAAMTTLALFWPMPGLAASADPLAHARLAAGAVPAEQLEHAVAMELTAQLPHRPIGRGTAVESAYWAYAFTHPGVISDTLDFDALVTAMTGDIDPNAEEADDPTGLGLHIELALQTQQEGYPSDAVPADLAETLAALAAHSPANIAWRAFGRLVHDQPDVTIAGQWRAAAIVASGLRSLFARLESSLLLDKLMPPDLPYWRAVLRYCAWGNLQAVMDEYLHHLALAEGASTFDDDRLIALALTAANAISIRPARYESFNPARPSKPHTLNARFALRYGGRKQNEESSRQPEVRQAFNSPFWPFVLATTSVGQEGIDFHWWSHALLHWNTPANPVDFEQREGRIHRYAGHAVRRNLTHRHGTAMLTAPDPDVWDVAYRLGEDERGHLGEFTPHWVYPGPSQIERHVAPYPLSIDGQRLDRIKQDVALYRLTFGQPRQEDLLELLRLQGVQHEPTQLEALRLDLQPPGTTLAPPVTRLDG